MKKSAKQKKPTYDSRLLLSNMLILTSKIMSKKTTKNNKGLTPTMVVKSEKDNDYVYVLKNGSELRFKSNEFPIQRPLIANNGQLLIF
jgi:hypothetical protein